MRAVRSAAAGNEFAGEVPQLPRFRAEIRECRNALLRELVRTRTGCGDAGGRPRWRAQRTTSYAIGGGGSDIQFRTFNGDIMIRKR